MVCIGSDGYRLNNNNISSILANMHGNLKLIGSVLCSAAIYVELCNSISYTYCPKNLDLSSLKPGPELLAKRNVNGGGTNLCNGNDGGRIRELQRFIRPVLLLIRILNRFNLELILPDFRRFSSWFIPLK